MKILQTITSFPPAYAYGGPVRSAYHISKNLVDLGHEVTVYTTDVLDSDSRLYFDENPTSMDGITVRRFRNISNTLAYKYNLDSAPQMGFSLNRHLGAFDVVHVHDYRSVQSIFVHHFAEKHGVPYLLQPRGTLPRQTKYLQKKMFDAVLGGSIVRDAAGIIASSRIESSQYGGIFPEVNEEKIVQVPNGIDIDQYRDLPEQKSFRQKYSIEPETDLVLFLSRIHERKGPDLLIEAVAELNDERDDLMAVIAGPDEDYLDQLQSHSKRLGVEKNVLFPGPLYGEDKREAYVDADVFVLPSKDRYESFGNVVLEALACGTPVVMTDVCGVSEWIPEAFAETAKPNSRSLVDAITVVLGEHRTWSRDDIQNYLDGHLSWEQITKELEEIYTKVVVYQ